jgi:hypothetical protein
LTAMELNLLIEGRQEAIGDGHFQLSGGLEDLALSRREEPLERIKFRTAAPSSPKQKIEGTEGS